MTHYQVLGVPSSASAAEIKRAYWHLARRWHPDKLDGDALKMQQINDAYKVLSRPERRATYDASLGLTPPPMFAGVPELSADAFKGLGEESKREDKP